MTINRTLTVEEERIQQLKEREKALRLDIQRRERALNEKKKRLRKSELIEKGELLERLGLLDCDKETLIGALLEIKQLLTDNTDKAQTWKQAGLHHLIPVQPESGLQPE